jgi:hypothetical protein
MGSPNEKDVASGSLTSTKDKGKETSDAWEGDKVDEQTFVFMALYGRISRQCVMSPQCNPLNLESRDRYDASCQLKLVTPILEKALFPKSYRILHPF